MRSELHRIGTLAGNVKAASVSISSTFARSALGLLFLPRFPFHLRHRRQYLGRGYKSGPSWCTLTVTCHTCLSAVFQECISTVKMYSTNAAYLTCNRVKWCVTCVGQVQLRGYMVTYVDLWIYTTVTEQLCLADSFTSTFSIESRMTISCSLWDIINAFAMSSWKNILPIVLLLWTLSNHLYWS